MVLLLLLLLLLCQAIWQGLHCVGGQSTCHEEGRVAGEANSACVLNRFSLLREHNIFAMKKGVWQLSTRSACVWFAHNIK
jgi:hypothetical protein